MLWLWTLGRAIETAFGPLALGLLLLTSAFVSSSFQLAIFDNVGVGASGVGFRVVRVRLAGKGQERSVESRLTPKVGILFVTWFLACWLIWTRTVGNGAHLGGLLFGAAAAEAVVIGRRPRLAKAVTAFMLVLALAVSFVCPWSATWWSTKAYKVHAAGHFKAAIEGYELSLQLRPDQPWVMANLIRAYRAEGKKDEAASLLAKLKSLSSAEAAKLGEELNGER